MPVAITKQTRSGALRALKEAEAFVLGLRETVDGDAKTVFETFIKEARKLNQLHSSLIMALLNDDYAPGELFKPWASIRRIQQWRDDPAVKLDVIIRHGRTCVKPAAFFKHWNSLPDESKK